MQMFLVTLSACSQGLMWAVMVLGLYITYKILNYADMTVDGSMTLGGSISAVIIFNGFDPFISLLVALISGAIAGIVTGILNTKLKIPTILSGILTMTALYSINIRIMGKANTSLIGKNTVFSSLRLFLESYTPVAKNEIAANIGPLNISMLILGFIVCTVLVAGLYWFFGTELGSAIRASGDNEDMSRALGINTNAMKIISLALSNALVALSGAFVAQSQGYADVNMGTGTIVIGLASIIIGETLIKGKGKNAFLTMLISALVGSVAYRIIISFVIMLGMNSSDLKLFTAVIVAFALFIPKIKFRERISNARI